MAIFISLLPLLIILAIIAFFVFKANSKMSDIPSVVPGEGVNVPVFNAYIGYRLFNVHNGIWPKFTLFEDHFDYRVLQTRSCRYEQVDKIDYYSGIWGMGADITMSFTDGRWNLSLNMNTTNSKEVLKFLKQKGCKLTEQAEKMLAPNEQQFNN